jgi:hypothetical protein
MAVGDVINAIPAQVANYSYFQPAAGVEIMILSLSSATNNHYFLYNGTNQGAWTNTDVSAGSKEPTNMKIGITNTNYLAIYNTGAYGQYTGIQIK